MKQKLLLFLCLLCVVSLKAQTVGTTSVHPIILSSGTTTVVNQQPDSLTKWYKLTLSNSNFALKVKSIIQGNNYPLKWAEIFIYDSSNALVNYQKDSLRTDSTLLFNIVNIPSGGKAYTKFNFDLSCNTCSTVSTNLNFTINEYSLLNSCTVTPTGCEFVYNNSFENFTIPCSALGIQQALNPYPACNWSLPNFCSASNPTVGTSDYYNSCYTNPTAYTYGYNYATNANTGNACGGLFLYSGSSTGTLNFREYLTEQLTSSLTLGANYQLNIYVKAANRTYFTSDLNLYLCSTLPCQAGSYYISTSSLPTGQMLTLTSSAITNTATWQLFTVNFNASAAWDKIIIGNFKSEATTALTTNTSAPEFYPTAAYYYIDDVSIKPQLNYTVTNSNPTLCSGSSSTITINGTLGTTYLWQPGSLTGTSNIVSPTFTTNYTITATSSLGCTSSTVVTINVLPPFSGFGLSTTNASLCVGSNATLSASGPGLNTYTWVPSNIQNTSIIITPTVSTTYTAIATNTNGCKTSSQIFISVVIPSSTFTLSSATNVICTNFSATSNTVTASSGSSLNYTWQPGPLSGSVQVVSPTVTTIYTVNAITSSGCNATNTLAVFVQTACCTAGKGVSTFTSNYYSGGTFTGIMTINADITFGGTSNYPTFQNGDFRIALGVKITVLIGVGDFQVLGAHLHACGATMWKGIDVQNGSRFLAAGSGTTGNSSFIEDAITAVNFNSVTNASPSYPVEITNTIFNKNYVAINVNSANTTTVPIFHVSQDVFSTRNFTYTSTSWPKTSVATPNLRYATTATTGISAPYALQGSAVATLLAPYNYQSARTGIQMTDVGSGSTSGYSVAQIGVTDEVGATDFNLFDNLQYGIDANNSSLSSVNNVYQSIQLVYICPPASFCYYDGGSGIRSQVATTLNARLNLSTTGTGSTSVDYGNRFWECTRGVEAYNVYQFNATYATFRSTQSTASGTTGINPGNAGIGLSTNRFNYYMTNNEFTNINNAINVPIIAGT